MDKQDTYPKVTVPAVHVNRTSTGSNSNSATDTQKSDQQPRQLPNGGTAFLRPFSSQPRPDQMLGPYVLGKTLGTGASGIHSVTGEKVAVKIIPKHSKSDATAATEEEEPDKQNRMHKLEREIAIMKLIRHPNVLCLHDVYESKDDLFLVMDYVDGGELFDYLVKKKRLDEAEAKLKFRQIIAAVDYCHRHLITHRDLKLENILLDSQGRVKVADFGMASIQAHGRLLETSCGSPHYASPEVVKGLKYEGEATDVWSCGVILYALLAGCLPFDDPNTRQLLHKVRRGIFHMPSIIPPDAADLIRKMLTVNSEERIKLSQIRQHPWLVGSSTSPDDNSDNTINSADYYANSDGSPLNNPPSAGALRPYTEETIETIDPEILETLHLLGYGRIEDILKALCAPEPNFEKVFYWLLDQKKTEQLENFNELRDSVISPSLASGGSASPGGLDDDWKTPRKRVSSRSSIGAAWRHSSMFLTPNGSMVDLSVLRTVANSSTSNHNNGGPLVHPQLSQENNFGSSRNSFGSELALSTSPPSAGGPLAVTVSLDRKRNVAANSRPVNPSPLSLGILAAKSQLAEREEQQQQSSGSPRKISTSSTGGQNSKLYVSTGTKQPIFTVPIKNNTELMEEFRRLQVKRQSTNDSNTSIEAALPAATTSPTATTTTITASTDSSVSAITAGHSKQPKVQQQTTPASLQDIDELTVADRPASASSTGSETKSARKRFDLLAKIRGATRSVFSSSNSNSHSSAPAIDADQNQQQQQQQQHDNTNNNPPTSPNRPDSPMISIDPTTTKSWFDSLLKFRPGTFHFQQNVAIEECKLAIVQRLQAVDIIYQLSDDGHSLKCRYQSSLQTSVKFRISFVEDVINKNDGDGGGQTTTIITFTQQQGALSAFNQACERFRDMHDSPGLINMK